MQDKAREGLQRLLNLMFANADQALQTLAGKARSNAEQNLYFESMRELRFKRRGIERFFIESVASSFSQLIKVGDVTKEESVLQSKQSLDQLTLVNDDDLEDQLAVDGIASRALASSEKPLKALSAKLAQMLDMRMLAIEDNPLGPHVLCGAFLQVCSQLEVETQSKRVFSRLFERYVLADLGDFYAKLLHYFPAPEVNEQVTEATTVPSVDESDVEIGDDEKISDDFVPKMASAAAWDTSRTPLLVPAGKAMAMPRALLDELLQAVQNTLAEGGLEHRALRPELISVSLPVHELIQHEMEERDYERPMALPFDDAEIIGLVGKLFQHMLDNASVPSAIEPLLKLIQLPVLRAALKDRELMQAGDHPARQLLNEITGACVGWTPEAELDKDPFYSKLADTAQALVNDYEGDAEEFETAVLDVQGWLKAERGLSKLVEQRTIDAESSRGQCRGSAAAGARHHCRRNVRVCFARRGKGTANRSLE